MHAAIAATVTKPFSSRSLLKAVAGRDPTFCEVGHADSLAHLRHHLAPRLLHYGIDAGEGRGVARAGEIRARAIFEPNDPHVIERAAAIDPDDPDLRATLDVYHLVLKGGA
jgi:hypothetical protein